MFRTCLKPGDAVSQTQVFRVHHYQHRLAHLAWVLFEILPECVQCGDKVRFETAVVDHPHGVELLRADRDFTHAVGKLPARSVVTAGARRSGRR